MIESKRCQNVVVATGYKHGLKVNKHNYKLTGHAIMTVVIYKLEN